MISDAGLLALNKALLENPCLTLSKLKNDLKLIASKRTIGRALHQLGWLNMGLKCIYLVGYLVKG